MGAAADIAMRQNSGHLPCWSAAKLDGLLIQPEVRGLRRIGRLRRNDDAWQLRRPGQSFESWDPRQIRNKDGIYISCPLSFLIPYFHNEARYKPCRSVVIDSFASHCSRLLPRPCLPSRLRIIVGFTSRNDRSFIRPADLRRETWPFTILRD